MEFFYSEHVDITYLVLVCYNNVFLLFSESSSSHYIPRGHLFEWVSCPHYLCEIIIYSSLCIIFGGKNDFLLALTLFVCITQICSGILTHQWYRRTFTSYPPSRTAIIPYLLWNNFNIINIYTVAAVVTPIVCNP